MKRSSNSTSRDMLCLRWTLSVLVMLSVVLSGAPVAMAAPQAPQATTIIAALSDYGSGTTLEGTVASMIAGWNPARIVTAGDNYHYQNCTTFATCVGNYYGSYVTDHTFMPAMGNHDYDTAVGGLTAWNNYFTWLPTSPDSQRRWYDFVVGDVHFFILDGNGNQATQSTWLSTAVPASTSVWNIAVIHQAPYSTGYYGDLTASQLPYGQYGIDFVISGHNHHFERLVKADGGKTVRYFIDGYGGTDAANHSECSTHTSAAASEFCLADVPGAIKLTASDTSITFEYYSSTGALQNTYTQVIGPEITASVSSLSPFSTTPGSPSAAQTYTVSGSDLTANISISAPAGFEISTNGSTYSSGLTLTQSGGSVGATTIYARLTGAAGGSFSGNIAHTGTGATTKNVAVSGTVGTAPTCVTSRISVTGNDAEERNDNGAVDLDGDTSTHSLQTYRAYAGSSTSTLNWWGLRFLSVNVPQGATIASADVTFRANLASDATASGMTLWGQLATSPATFTTGTNNITSRTRTSASATWTLPQWTSGSDYATPDLSAVVQEIVNQSGWAANNALVVIGQTTVTQNRSAVSFDGTSGSTLAPLLELCYTTLPAGPTITTSVSTLSPFGTAPGSPSAAQTYTVSGSDLTEHIVITPPAGFELSTNGSTYNPSLTLTQSGGVVATTTIYVRLNSATEGTFSGNITHASTGATTKNVAVSGTVSNCSTVNLTAAEDTYLSANDVTYNNGGNTVIHVDATTGTSRRTALLKWDVSSIPSNATVSAASLSLNITDASPLVFNLYNMRRTWVEGTSSQAASSNSANWNTYNGADSWGTVGAANTSSDRYDTNLWGATTSSFSTTGSKTEVLNTSGVAVVQGWIAGSTSNYGLIMQNYSGSTSNAVYFSSSEATTATNRPLLNVTYCASTSPTINTSGTLTAFSTQPGVPSAAQTYTVSGSNLTENIVITPPAGFELSTNGSTYNASLTLTQSGGSVASTTIHVRLNSGTEGSFSGNIIHTSSGATTKNVAVSGTVSNCSTVNLTATEDTYLSANDVTYNNGGNTELHVDATTGTSRRTTLLKWDVSSVPSNATVSAASLSLYVTDASPLVFNLYNMRRAWVEGTGTRTASTTSANWNTYDGSASWGTVGAANTSSDRYDTNLWGATTSSFSTTGSKTEALSTDGVAVVQGWVAGTTSNYGLVMQNYSGSTSNAVYVSSSEATTTANRPKLNVTYCVATGPTIITTGAMTAFSSSPGVPSDEQSYTVTGSNLTTDIVVTAPADFEISTMSESGFGSSLTLQQSGGSVAATPIYVRFNRATLGTSSGNITHTSTGATAKNVAVSGTASTVNHAPAAPALVQPADDAMGISTSPTLEVTVSDPDPADTLSVSFYGRVAGTTAGEDFTLVVIPDSQNAATSYPAVFNSMTQWIADNKTSQNIVFATSVGDIVNTSSSTTEWTRADAAYGILDAANVAYSVGPGNHDLGGLYNTYFGASRFSGKSWYQGYYGSDNYNNYSFFSASGNDFILINLQYSPTTAQLDWADALLKANPARRGIVEQHNILNTDNSWNSQATYTALKDNPNLFLMLCGHMHTSGDGAAYRAELGDDGHTIHIVMADYQDFPNGGNGYLRILRFSPADDKIYATTYSPYSNAYITTSPDQMEMAYDMAGGAAFELIGTVTGVTNGGNAPISWPDRVQGIEYEWYAVVSDGSLSTTGSTWSFTTAAPPQPPTEPSISLNGSNVGLGWDAVTHDVNGNPTTIIKYQVYGSNTSPYFTSGGELLGEPTAPAFTHTGGSTGAINWYYLVRAVNAAGESVDSPQRTGRFGFLLTPGTTP